VCVCIVVGVVAVVVVQESVLRGIAVCVDIYREKKRPARWKRTVGRTEREREREREGEREREES